MASKTINILGTQQSSVANGQASAQTVVASNAAKTWTTGDSDAHKLMVIARGLAKGHWTLRVYDKNGNVYAEDSRPMSQQCLMRINIDGAAASFTPYEQGVNDGGLLKVDAASFATGIIEYQFMGALSNLSPMIQSQTDGSIPVQFSILGNGVLTIQIPFTVSEVA